jgi:hypothetical protein
VCRLSGTPVVRGPCFTWSRALTLLCLRVCSGPQQTRRFSLCERPAEISTNIALYDRPIGRKPLRAETLFTDSLVSIEHHCGRYGRLFFTRCMLCNKDNASRSSSSRSGDHAIHRDAGYARASEVLCRWRRCDEFRWQRIRRERARRRLHGQVLG